MTHESADPDAIGSLQAIFSFVKSCVGKDAVFGRFPFRPNRPTKKLLEKVPTALPKPVNPSPEFDLWVFLDFHDPSRFLSASPEDRANSTWVVIDHHELVDPGVLDNFATDWVDPARPSTSEMVAELLLSLDWAFPQVIDRTWLLLGMLTDSRNFKLARGVTLDIFARLLPNGVKVGEVASLLDAEVDLPEKIAKLKGARRAETYIFDQWVVSITRVSSFEGRVSRALIGLGADVAFTISEKKGGPTRVAGRASDAFLKATGFNLARFLGEISEDFEGSGGGHDGAASLSGRATPGEVSDKILNSLHTYLKTTPKEAGR
ncbi:MAG: DHH family phosphoesterase [Promethearchaeota archaeon]